MSGKYITDVLNLIPRGTSGPPSSGTSGIGDIIVDSEGVLWVCTTAGTTGGSWSVGASGSSGTSGTSGSGTSGTSAIGSSGTSGTDRWEETRVGKESRSRWTPEKDR